VRRERDRALRRGPGVRVDVRRRAAFRTFFRNTLTVMAGPDVYQMFDYSGTDDEPSPALMSQLIRQVQQLR
jgi:hypothetical protein